MNNKFIQMNIVFIQNENFHLNEQSIHSKQMNKMIIQMYEIVFLIK